MSEPGTIDGTRVQRALFELLYGGHEGYARIGSKDKETREWRTYWFKYPSQVDEMLDFIRRMSGTRDLYFCAHLFRKKKAEKVNALPPKAVWADLDYCDPAVLKLKPSVLLKTSNDRHAGLWLLKDFVDPEKAEYASKKIAFHHESDGCDTSGWDLGQLLRIPFTYNYKYGGPVPVTVVSIDPKLKYDISDFDIYEDVTQQQFDIIDELPQEGDRSAEQLIADYEDILHPMVFDLFENTPDDDWSAHLWNLECSLFEAGMSAVDVFTVVKKAACNKYERDRRGQIVLWQEVQRAGQYVEQSNRAPIIVPSRNRLSQLITDDEAEAAEMAGGFVEDYIGWAKSLSDAAWQYHQAGGFIILSALLSGAVRIPTSYGNILPNLWFMILGNTTLTRKSTSMDIAIEGLLEHVNDSALLATDGSIEGLMTALQGRPGKPSIFLRDEFTGLIDQVGRKDYYSGMLESLTKLYDGKNTKRILRSETIEIKEPVFIIYAGGIKSKMLQILRDEHIISGFLPRFVFITADTDISKLKPLGPPTEQNKNKQKELIERAKTMHDFYWQSKRARITSAGVGVKINHKHDVTLTPDAWKRYNRLQHTMLQDAIKSNREDTLTPVFERLSMSGLKTAALLSASDKLQDSPVVEESHVIRAFYYVTQWREHSMFIVDNIGLSADEQQIQSVLAHVLKSPGVTTSVISQAHKLDSKRLQLVMNTLIDRALIRVERKGRTKYVHPIVGGE